MGGKELLWQVGNRFYKLKKKDKFYPNNLFGTVLKKTKKTVYGTGNWHFLLSCIEMGKTA